MSGVRIFTALLAGGIVSWAVAAQAQEDGPRRPMDFAAMHREFCTDHLARKAAGLAYISAKLNLTASQRPLWDSYYQSVMSSARSQEQACLQSPAPSPDIHQTILDHESREVRMLQAKLQAVQSSQPALAAFYQTLTPDQKAIIDETHHHGHHSMMGHGMMDGKGPHPEGPMGDHSYH